jgi:flagellar hook-associated protein 1
MAGSAYTYNYTGGSAFADRLNQYVTSLATPRSFDPAVQLAPSETLSDFASSSSAWLQETRKVANDDAGYADTLLQRTSDALSKETGVSIDEEMTALLELERAYQASTRLISTIDSMMKTLLAATG